MKDTIVAISTSLGKGAIAIIKISGEEAIEIVNGVFKGKNLEKVKSHTINYGYIVDGEETIDEVLVSVMRGPKTFTTEDVVEINCHGGIITSKRIFELLLRKGCRLAEAGEFTKRAFLNGRINLLEAEAIFILEIISFTNASISFTFLTFGFATKSIAPTLIASKTASLTVLTTITGIGY